MSVDKKYVLITGATVGIGYELAKLFAKNNNNLILVARNKENLENVAIELKNKNVDVIVKSVDLSNMDECDELIKYIEEEALIVDKLVNNAGVGSFGGFKDIRFKDDEKLIDINIMALTKLTKYFVHGMVQRKSGGILNVASTAAFCAGPKMATYYASKAYVLNLTEALHEEVKDYGVNISCLCPGPVKTEFQSKAGIKKSEKAKKYLMDAKVVAKVGYDDFNKGKLIIIPGFKNKVLVLVNKFIPRSISRKIVFKSNNGVVTETYLK